METSIDLQAINAQSGATGQKDTAVASGGSQDASVNAPAEGPGYISFESLCKSEPEHRIINIEGLGLVEIRELNAGELIAVQIAALDTDPVTENVRFNLARHAMLQVAVALENPAIGATTDERILRVDTLRNIPARAYQRLAAEVEVLNNVDLGAVSRMTDILDAVPFLSLVMEVLAAKHGWLEDLDGKTKQEFILWSAFLRRQDRRSEEALARIIGG